MTSELMRGDSFDAKMLISGQISESIRMVGIGLLLSSSARAALPISPEAVAITPPFGLL